MLRAASSRRTDVLCDSLPAGQAHETKGNKQVEAWDAYVRAHPDATIFHTQGWRRAVANTFGHAPIYLSAQRTGHDTHSENGVSISGVLPLFQVNSMLLGRLLVSVPYGVGGGALTDSEETAGMLFDAACRAAEERRCRGIDLRSEEAAFAEVSLNTGYAGFKKRLPEDVSDVLVSLPRKARAAARQGRKKFSLTISYGIQHLPAVYQLYADSMHRLASLNYPYQFFEELHTSFKNDMWVSLVRWDDRPVAGLITFAFRDTVMPYFVGLSDNARQCHAANFIYLCTMERAVARGYSYFDFGRSRIDNTGSYNFKRFHGFEPRTLGYQFHTMPGNRPVSLSASSSRFSIARKLWTWCPRVVTKRLGARLAYHLPG